MQRRWGAARDIDLTSTSGAPLVFSQEESAPFSVDSSFEGLIAVDASGSTATVRYDAGRPEVAVKLPAEVFAPFPAVIGRLRVNTFHPDTMRRLHLIYNSIGPKDERETFANSSNDCGRSPFDRCRIAISNRILRDRGQ
jgi:hypothetical protein